MSYTLRITKTQSDTLGHPLPVEEFDDRFETAEAAADYARSLIEQRGAPIGAYTFDVLDEDGQPVDGLTGQEP